VDLVGCRPAGDERVPTPGLAEIVVFYDHFPRGFTLPVSSFLRRFLDHFRLKPHHAGAKLTREVFFNLWKYSSLVPRQRHQKISCWRVVDGTRSFLVRGE
jgi:hypothetical protein